MGKRPYDKPVLRVLTQADITVMLMEAGHLGDVDYDTAFNRVRTWQKRGKLPPVAAQRPTGQPLFLEDDVRSWAERLAP